MLGLTTLGTIHTLIGLVAPLFTGPEDPSLAKTIGVIFVVFLIGATLQIKRMRRAG